MSKGLKVTLALASVLSLLSAIDYIFLLGISGTLLGTVVIDPEYTRYLGVLLFISFLITFKALRTDDAKVRAVLVNIFILGSGLLLLVGLFNALTVGAYSTAHYVVSLGLVAALVLAAAIFRGKS